MKAILLALALGAATCGGASGTTVSCTLPASGAKDTCSQVDNAPEGSGLDQLRQTCEANGGLYQSAACDRAGSLGGCRMTIQGASFSTIIWYYPSGSIQTQADVMAACSGMQATFVAA